MEQLLMFLLNSIMITFGFSIFITAAGFTLFGKNVQTEGQRSFFKGAMVVTGIYCAFVAYAKFAGLW